MSARKDMQRLADRLMAVTAFCIVHSGKCYQGWPPDRIFKYLAFQHASGGLIVQQQGPDIVGVMTAWRADAGHILAAEAEGWPQFNWRLPARTGDALMIGDVIMAGACGPQLLRAASAHWPDWRTRRIFTCRRGELHEISAGAVERFLRVHQPENS